jgi:hypothetical protein
LLIVGTALVSTNVVPGIVDSWDQCRTPEPGVFIPEDHPYLKLDKDNCILFKEEKRERSERRGIVPLLISLQKTPRFIEIILFLAF